MKELETKYIIEISIIKANQLKLVLILYKLCRYEVHFKFDDSLYKYFEYQENLEFIQNLTRIYKIKKLYKIFGIYVFF